MTWTDKDLANLKAKGMKITDSKVVESDHLKKPKKLKIVKISVEKRSIELILQVFHKKGLFNHFVAEHRFHDVRMFKFDWAIIDYKIAIEYEGVMSEKSRHTTVKGYSQDIEKYNLAQIHGWKVLRYTALNYKNFGRDLMDLINKNNHG